MALRNEPRIYKLGLLWQELVQEKKDHIVQEYAKESVRQLGEKDLKVHGKKIKASVSQQVGAERKVTQLRERGWV